MLDDAELTLSTPPFSYLFLLFFVKLHKLYGKLELEFKLARLSSQN